MTERDDTETQLRGYLRSLPAERRPIRDRAARRERLLPRLRAHVARERRRVHRRRALVRAAALVALGGAGATALWLALPAHRPMATAATAISSASALTVLDGALWLRGDSGAHALRAGESVALADMTAFESPADRPARVRVADIVAMTLAPGSRARPMVTASAGAGPAMLAAGATPSLAIALERGRAHFEVRKLQGEHRFHVMTPDADVEVRGTVFDVALSLRADAPTCVSVDEGLVQVAKGLRTRLLARGESWDCGAANEGDSASAAPATESAARPASESGEPRRRAGARVTGSGTKARADHPRTVTRTGGLAADAARVAPSDLRAQNELFQAALSAERAGHTDEAARFYRQLLARAPEGPLSAQARANLAAVAGARR